MVMVNVRVAKLQDWKYIRVQDFKYAKGCKSYKIASFLGFQDCKFVGVARLQVC